jgi:phosphoribosylanthranilate isomerase
VDERVVVVGRQGTAVKVCCIASEQEARQAILAGATAIGLVSRMPSGPGVIADERIAGIAAVVSPPVRAFLLTSRTDAPSIVRQQRASGADTIQLVDRVEDHVRMRLREELPGVALVQVVHVTGRESVDEALSVQDGVDAILLDSGSFDGDVKELGGTGRTHDWSLSRRIRSEVTVPVFLAGGLGASICAAASEPTDGWTRPSCPPSCPR